MTNLNIIFLILISIAILSCEKKIGKNQLRNQAQVINSNKVNLETIKFSDLFNEGSIIKFSPKELVNPSDDEILDFKEKLDLYEDQNTVLEDFEPENLKILVNDETFSESNHFVNSEWLDYYIKKYHLENYLKDIMKIAIEQEDYNAVKVLLKDGYIISSKELNIAKDAKIKADEIKKINLKNDGLHENGDPTFYDSNASMIDDILKFIEEKYNKNKIYDKDGYTNLREDANVNSKVISKIASGKHIMVLDNIEKNVIESQKGWCYIQTEEGLKGYIHKSRIASN
ncbi:SH3 domain-containing protein [Flavobacterium sp. MR2016-29]|uniref:SH3 domain-containing protein n=1 Tax=Flavobacterium sp. MR2016-29 TaxID=2783795 RepID=UPI00188A65A4|nr:SH3 domain-containing protein [Flavobacterium sp. MR2016-29]MBF4491719.1 SH3 domain-containing protein [Flavobacterium sp. MR2016-29]